MNPPDHDLTTASDVLRPKPRKPPLRSKPLSDALALEIATVLNDRPHLAMYRFFCERFDNEAVRRAYLESRAVPIGELKRSRPSLFIALIRKYALPKNDHPRD